MSAKTSKIPTLRVSGVKKILKNELIPFTRQTASMLNAGMSILAAVSTLEDQCANPNFKRVLRVLRESIESGMPFSDGLRHFPQIFDDMYLNMVRLLQNLVALSWAGRPCHEGVTRASCPCLPHGRDAHATRVWIKP